MSEYDEQAKKFLEETGTEFSVEFIKHDVHFPDDRDTRDIYEVTLKRGNRIYAFKFGQSVSDSGVKHLMPNHSKDISGDFMTQEYRKQLIDFDTKDADDRRRLKAKFMLKMGQHVYPCSGRDEFQFGISPTAYSVLASLQKYDPGSFEDFCSGFGYDNDSKKAEKTYNAVKGEWQNVERLFNEEELEKLQEVQ